MKWTRMFVMVALALMVAACGSSTSSEDSTAGLTTMVSSVNALNSIWLDSEVAACIAGTTQSADCPGGGTMSWSGNQLVASSCKSSDGKTFAGTISSSDGLTIDGEFTTFGDCTDVSGQNLPTGTCGGTLTGTCGGTSGVTCTLADDGTGTTCTCSELSSSGSDSGGSDDSDSGSGGTC